MLVVWHLYVLSTALTRPDQKVTFLPGAVNAALIQLFAGAKNGSFSRKRRQCISD